MNKGQTLNLRCFFFFTVGQRDYWLNLYIAVPGHARVLRGGLKSDIYRPETRGRTMAQKRGTLGALEWSCQMSRRDTYKAIKANYVSIHLSSRNTKWRWAEVVTTTTSLPTTTLGHNPMWQDPTEFIVHRLDTDTCKNDNITLSPQPLSLSTIRTLFPTVWNSSWEYSTFNAICDAKNNDGSDRRIMTATFKADLKDVADGNWSAFITVLRA